MSPILQFFTYEHLPKHLQEVSKPFGKLAKQLDEMLIENPEKTVKFLESRLNVKEKKVEKEVVKTKKAKGVILKPSAYIANN